jgi:hypothetical protein
MSVLLYLDDVRSPPEGWTLVKTVEEAKALLLAGEVECASLDHDLGIIEVRAGVFEEREAPTGYDLVKWMMETGHWPKRKPVVHSANPPGAAAMRQAIERHWRRP